MPTCLECGKDFASRQTLYTHRKRLHSDSMEKKDLAKSIVDKIDEKPKRKFQKKNSISKPMQDSEKPKRKFQDKKKNSKPMQDSDSSSEEIPCGSKRQNIIMFFTCVFFLVLQNIQHFICVFLVNQNIPE